MINEVVRERLEALSLTLVPEATVLKGAAQALLAQGHELRVDTRAAIERADIV